MIQRKFSQNPVSQHVVIKIACPNGQTDAFSIKDINPNNTKGIPKFEATIFCKRFEFSNEIDIDRLYISLFALFEHLNSIKKSKKIKVMLVDKIPYNYKAAAALTSISEVYEDFEITVSVDFKENSIFQKIDQAQKRLDDLIKKTSFDIAGQLYESCSMRFPDGLLLEEKGSFSEPNLKSKRCVIVDTHNLYHRTYHGMPSMQSKSGKGTQIPKALTTTVLQLIKEKYDFAVFASEGADSIRKKIYDQYKANREERPEDLIDQINTADQIVKEMGFFLAKEEGYEADDIVASYAKKLSKWGADVVIISTDKDLLQLVNSKVKIYNPMKKILLGEEECLTKLGVPPTKVPDYLAITGDASDNIPGVKGLGQKAAVEILSQCSSIEEAFERLENLKPRFKKLLLEHKEEALLSKKLTTLFDHLAEDIDLQKVELPANPIGSASTVLKDLNINV